MYLMTNTKRINTKSLRATCPHANVITLGDGAAVCTRCEAVIPAAKAVRQ